MPESYELKPKRAAFVTYGFMVQLIPSIFVVAIIATALSAVVSFSVALTVVLAFILLQAWTYYSLAVRHRKEKYVFFRDRIVRKSGCVFSNSETELVIRNITHVTMKLPYVENRLFGTGSINIQSAGSGGVEVRLSSVDNPEKFYEYAERLMKANGFSLAKKSLVQKEKPSTLGIFFEVFKNFLTLIIVGIYFFPLGNGAIIYMSSKGSVYGGILIFFAALAVLIFFLHLLFKFLDLKRRVYEIYSDTIIYSEGFLSKNYAFIPMENLSDSEVTQTFVDKVFGLYDVKISCQGAGSEILFKNMRNGHELEANIDKRISNFKHISGKLTATKATVRSFSEKQQPSARKQASLNPEYLAEFKMQMFRTLAPLLLVLAVVILIVIIALIVFGFSTKTAGGGFALIGFGFTSLIMLVPAAIITLVSRIIKVSSTRYLLKKESVEERYDFLTSKHKEFTNEKVMAVVFKENFIDKWFKTCSVHFWSIGSAESIKFSNMKKSDRLYESILSKIGIKHEEPLYSTGSQFSFVEMLKADIIATFFLSLFIVGVLVMAVIVNWLFLALLIILVLVLSAVVVYKTAYYKRSKLCFYRNFVHFRCGIFFEELYYAPNENVKGITTLKYPFSKKGNLTFDVAGEQSFGASKNRGTSVIAVSSQFTINYIPEIATKDDLIDLLFHRKPSSAVFSAKIVQNISKRTEPLLVSKPAVINTVFESLAGIVFISVVCLIPVIYFTMPISTFFELGSFSLSKESFFGILVGFISLLSLVFGIIVPTISVKAKSYIIESYRLIAKSGVIYKEQKSITFNKIDHINLNQGLLNRMFGNGVIIVNTTGSSIAEMMIKNIPDFKKFYEELQKRYQAKA